MIDLPSTKHGVFHACPYCNIHVKTSGLVPSVSSNRWIAVFNFLMLLEWLGIKSAERKHNDILGSGKYGS